MGLAPSRAARRRAPPPGRAGRGGGRGRSGWRSAPPDRCARSRAWRSGYAPVMVAMPWARIALLFATVAVILAGCLEPGVGTGSSASAGSAQTASGSPVAAGPAAPSGMAVVTVADLPREAGATLLLVEA